MNAEEKGFSIGAQYGILGILALVVGCGYYGYLVKRIIGESAEGLPVYETKFLFQTAPWVVVPVIIGITGVIFLVFSYREHILSWRTSRINKVLATAIILFFISILTNIINMWAAVAVAVSGGVCLAFAAWKWIRRYRSR